MLSVLALSSLSPGRHVIVDVVFLVFSYKNLLNAANGTQWRQSVSNLPLILFCIITLYIHFKLNAIFY